MPSLTIKGLPEPLYQRLKQRAAQHHRSLNSEVIVCLELAANQSAFDPEKWLRQVDLLRESWELPPLTDSQLRAAKGSGRP